MAAMLVKLIFVFIFVDRSTLRWAIWLCMYWRKVSDVHLPIFIIVVSLTLLSFRAMAPPALRECTPTRSGSIPALCRSSCFIVFLIALRMSFAVTWSHWGDWDWGVCVATAHMSVVGVPPCARMWWILRAMAFTGQCALFLIAWWWMVCPILPFFWFVIFRVHWSAVTRDGRGLALGSIFPCLKNPTSQTLNCTVRVARFCFPWIVIIFGLVYSPTRSR